MLSHRYIFIAGLHRTGTSLLAQLMGQHPQITSISGAPVPENEGCYLQGAIPHTARDGIPGKYAIDPRQYHTEESALNTWDIRMRLEAEWSVWFDPAKPWRLEKSPVNLTRMRLLQGLFPMAHFIVITRHPAAMAQALRKWDDAPVQEHEDYGIAAYERALNDMRYLHHAVCLRYEDFIARPQAILRGLATFLDLNTPFETSALHNTLRNGNADYPRIADSVARFEALGYEAGGEIAPFEPIVQHPLRAHREGAQGALRGTGPTVLK
ncbi:MAG: sulfotransferase [Pseudomonadota bacterium]